MNPIINKLNIHQALQLFIYLSEYTESPKNMLKKMGSDREFQ